MNFFEKHQKILAICGIIAPIIFAIIVIISGLLRPDYNQLVNFVSELGAVGAPNAIIQRINFMLLGILIVAFTFGLHRGIGNGKGSIIGPLLIGHIRAKFGGIGDLFNRSNPTWIVF